jgi:hypothetical protein
MVWAAIGTAVVGGVVSMATKPKAGKATAAADPFAAQRPQYQTQLKSLMDGEFSPSDPSYQWRFDQGMESVNRSMAAQGLIGSGRQLAELTDYGQGMASTEYGNQYQRLAQLSGANVGSPATAGQIQYGQDQYDRAGSTAFGGMAGKLAGDVIGGWGSSGGNDSVDMTGFQSGVGGGWDNYDWSGSNSTPSNAYPVGSLSGDSTFGAGWMT